MTNARQVLQGFGDYLEALKIRFIDEIVNFIEDVNHERFTDRAHILLVLQIAVMTDRILKNKLVKIPESDIEILRSNNHFSQATAIGEKILKPLNRKMTDGEIAYLSLLLLNAEVKMPIINQLMYRDTYESSSEKVKQIVDNLLRHATLYLHPALWLDDDLKDSLASHITRLMDPSKANRSVKNPLLEDIKQIYPEIYKLSTYGLETVQKLGLYASEDEVGFITMYFAGAMERLRLPTFNKKKVVIICNAGVATSKLLASRIQKEFPEIEIIDILSYLEYKNYKNDSGYDLVVSTVPITSWEKPAVIVNPLLDNNDIEKIRSIINSIDTSPADQESEFSYNTQYPLSSLLTLDTIKLQVAAENWEDVVDHAGSLLLKITAIEPKYIDAMKALRLEHGPYMVIMPGIALLHAYPESGVKRLCMSMVTLLNPIYFGHPEYDPVFVAFALGAVDNNSHLRALSQLIEMLEDKSAVEVIKSTYLKARVLNIVSKFSGK